MRITAISPIAAPKGEDFRAAFRLRDCKNIPAQFDFTYIDGGPEFILNDYDDVHAAPLLVKKALECQHKGADAIVINCSADTGARACREAASIPVIAPSECAMLYACQFVDAFAVLTFSNKINGRFRRIARNLGLEHRISAVESVEMEFSRLTNGADAVVDALYDTIRRVAKTTGTDGFILGCTDFEDVAPELARKLSENRVPALLFKPFEIAAYQAYITVAMGLNSGANSYPKPERNY